MPANTPLDELVAVNSLLIERETNLADLSHIETTISEILGQPYPFPEPSAHLPSTQKGRRVKHSRKPKAKANKQTKIRRLKPGEIGYRVTVLELGVRKTHDLLDIAPIQDQLSNPLPHYRILEVLTIDTALETVDTLFDSAEA